MQSELLQEDGKGFENAGRGGSQQPLGYKQTFPVANCSLLKEYNYERRQF